MAHGFGTIPPVAVLVALAAALACNNSVTCDCIGEPRLDVVSDGGEFLIRNRSAEHDLTVTVVEKNSLALIDPACEVWQPRIPPLGELRVPNAEVVGFFPEAETAIVWWCTLDGESVVDSDLIITSFSR